MSQDDKFLLGQIFAQEHAKNAPALKADKYFEIFSAERILTFRGFDLDPVQLNSGIVGDGGDGGVDSIYLFVNRKLVVEDSDPNLVASFQGQQLNIELIIIQSKNQDSFAEIPIQKLADFTENCLRLGTDLTAVPKTLYKESLLNVVARFHAIYQAALTHKPSLSITYYYASFGERIDGKVDIQQKLLLSKLRGFYSAGECDFILAGASSLFAWYNQPVSQDLILETAKCMNWTQCNLAYICLVPLPKFFKFITDKSGKTLRSYIFEANVRDYQGEVAVNQEIRATLAAPQQEEFWWLNNGVTVLASKVAASGDILTITDPLIVNGLQTAHEIYAQFKDIEDSTDSRTVLVRVIQITDAQSTDKIIKATNSQTQIPKIWLHATEPIHRKIQVAFESKGLFYDRRKNYYRNRGVPVTKIVTIPYLAQAMAAVVLQRPDDARARPTTVAERHYKQMFNPAYPMDLFLKAAQVLKRVDEFLDKRDLDRGHKLNLMFHVAMFATGALLKSAKPSRQKIAALNIETLTDELLVSALSAVSLRLKSLVIEDQIGEDQAAKGPKFADIVRGEMVTRFSRSTAPSSQPD